MSGEGGMSDGQLHGCTPSLSPSSFPVPPCPANPCRVSSDFDGHYKSNQARDSTWSLWTDCLFFKMPISLWLIWEKTLLKVMRSIQWVYENTFNQFSCQINKKSEQGLSSTVLHTKATPSFIPYLVQYGTKYEFSYGWFERRLPFRRYMPLN